MYSIFGYGHMIADTGRIAAYRNALRQRIRPDSVVLDIGSGTGIFAMLACQLGARRVYAIEPDSAIEIARENARANGFADRVRFIQGLSTAVELPEVVDVIVSDLRGVLPLFQMHLPAIIDARRRFLAPGGALIPIQDELFASIVHAPDLYRRQLTGCDEMIEGLKMDAARPVVLNNWRKARIESEQLIGAPKCWATIDYQKVAAPDLNGTISWIVERAEIGHGLALWFDSRLAPSVTMSNAPGLPEMIYGNGFFPWTRPVPLSAGDRVVVKLKAALVGADYIWCWDTQIFSPESPAECRTRFRQSTFFAVPLSRASLKLRAAHFNPVLSDRGRADRFVLELMEGGVSLGQIAERLAARFPQQFADWQHSLDHVADLAQKYAGRATMS